MTRLEQLQEEYLTLRGQLNAEVERFTALEKTHRQNVDNLSKEITLKWIELKREQTESNHEQ